MTYSTYTPNVILITGATGDFGKAFARRFAETGCKLVIHGRTESKVRALISDLEQEYNVQCAPLIFDLADKQGTIKALESISDDFKNIDVLVNNAGGALGADKAFESDLDDWESMIEMNNTSLVRITHHILKGMVERARGHIINIGSIAGNWPYPGGHVYCAVKAFTKQFSLALRSDLDGTNVRVTNIEPGMVETQFSLARYKGDKEKADAVYAGANALQADDIAESVIWVAKLPPHANVTSLEIMPTTQSSAGLKVHRAA